MPRISSILPQQFRARSQPAATTAAARDGISPRSAFISRSSDISSPSNPMRRRMMLPMIVGDRLHGKSLRSEEHTSALQSLLRHSYAVFCLKKKNTQENTAILECPHHI